MRRVWQFYRLETGALTEGLYTGPADLLEANTPAGHGAISGQWDPATQFVDIQTGEVKEGATAAQPRSIDVARAQANERRQAMLNASDWVVIRATEAGKSPLPEWLAYRQALRDLPQQPGFPLAIDWPTPPQS